MAVHVYSVLAVSHAASGFALDRGFDVGATRNVLGRQIVVALY
jgi:hypothetical protein